MNARRCRFGLCRLAGAFAEAAEEEEGTSGGWWTGEACCPWRGASGCDAPVADRFCGALAAEPTGGEAPPERSAARAPQPQLLRTAALLAGLLLASAACAQEPPLTRIAAVRDLAREEAARSLPARVRGVVTFVSGKNGGLVVDDGTGIYIGVWDAVQAGLAPDVAAGISPGEVVEVAGRTAAGHYAPVILAERVARAGRAPLPPPRASTLAELLTGRFDCQRVALRGVVQATTLFEDRGSVIQEFDLATEEGHCNVQLTVEAQRDPARLVDAEVRAEGVCLPYFNTRGELIGVRMQTNLAADIAGEGAPPAEPFAAPAVTLARLLPFAPEGPSLHRRRVAGTVSLCQPGEFFYLQEGTRGIRVSTRQADVLAPGERVEAAGFPERRLHFGELRESVFRRVGAGAPPEPVETTRAAILGLKLGSASDNVEDFDGRLVALRGRVERIEQTLSGGRVLYLESGGGLVPVELGAGREAASLLALRAGSEVRARGVCAMSFNTQSGRLWSRVQPEAFRLLLRDAADVTLLHAAPWWTPRRLWTALAITGGVLAAALAWAWTLRRRVARRGEQLAHEMRRRRDAQVEFEGELRERNRLAADLHDLLEQDLAAVGYQLEAERALREDDPAQARAHLALADQFLVHSRADVRRSVWNLRAGVLAGRSLADALRETAQRLCAGRGVPCEVASVAPGGPPLPAFIAGNLLLFAQEAISNALKHAAPRRIDIALAHDAAGVKLTIADDGRGFDPAAAHGPDRGHFGLTGMRERLKRLGGTLRFESAADQGTRLIAEVPAAEIEAARKLSDE